MPQSNARVSNYTHKLTVTTEEASAIAYILSFVLELVPFPKPHGNDLNILADKVKPIVDRLRTIIVDDMIREGGAPL